MSIHERSPEKALEQQQMRELQQARHASLPLAAKEKTYKINEIFYTIQGEALYAGTAAVFIRFSACNLACEWCDTEYDSGEKLTVGTILSLVLKMLPPSTIRRGGTKPIIVCTGGEPSLQMDGNFVATFRNAGFRLTMETNGIKWKDPMNDFDLITCSPKTMTGWWCGQDETSGALLATWKLRQGAKLVIKMVYDPENPLMDVMMDTALKVDADALFLQPLEDQEDGTTNADEVIQIVQEDPRWRLSLQTHKILGVR